MQLVQHQQRQTRPCAHVDGLQGGLRSGEACDILGGGHYLAGIGGVQQLEGIVLLHVDAAGERPVPAAALRRRGRRAHVMQLPRHAHAPPLQQHLSGQAVEHPAVALQISLDRSRFGRAQLDEGRFRQPG